MRTAILFQILFSLFLSQSLWAFESAVRQPGEDWEQALTKSIQASEAPQSLLFDSGRSAMSEAEYYRPNFDVRSLPEWNGSTSDLQVAFEKVRDERSYTENNRPNFLRRSSWLYPDDGCYTRAAHAVKSFERLGRPQPGKVFAFGRLRVKTNFAGNGSNTVWWSYHVAAGYRIGHRAIVIDPAVDPHQPLFLEDWLSRITKDVSRVRVALCESNTYSPTRLCRGARPVSDKHFLNHQKGFLAKEWTRVRNLKMNPERILGSEPPWARLIFGPHGLAAIGL